MMNLWISITWMFIGSLIVGYIITSSALVNTSNDIKNSLTKFYLALYMALWMVVIEVLMVAFHQRNFFVLLLILPLILIILLVWILLRKQMGVGDSEYLRAMIQHHSSAILTSERILEKTQSKKVELLATQIIKSQEAEIDIMNKWLDEY